MKYAESHEWIETKGERGRVGISSKAREELGEIVYVALPKVGDFFKKGDEVAVLESTKAAVDLYAPVSGTISAVNKALVENVASLNTDPEGEGYLFEITLSNGEELSELLSEKAYLSQFASELG